MRLAVFKPGMTTLPRLHRALAGLAAALGVLTLCSTASADPEKVDFFSAPYELSGALGPAGREETLTELDALGVGVVRTVVYWRQIAPSPDASSMPAGFDPRDPKTYGANGANWGQVDAVVRGATARGMEVSLVLSGQPPTGRVPRWASRDPVTQSDPDPAKFADFAYAVGRRYGGVAGSIGYARYISIWNEPNLTLFLNAASSRAPGSAVPALYRQLIAAGQTGLSSAGWRGVLLIGETAPTGGGKKALDPVPFFRRTLCLDKRFRPTGGCPDVAAAGWAHHPYSFAIPPFRPPFYRGQISFANQHLLQRGINRARRAGVLLPGAGLWDTEFGYPVKPATFVGVSPRRQAEYNAIAEYIAYRSPGVASFAQYLLRDDRAGFGPLGAFASGLCEFGVPAESLYAGDRICRPAFAGFRTALVARSRGRCVSRARGICAQRKQTARVQLWGHIRPATSPTEVVVRYRDRSGGTRSLTPVTTDAAGYFSFKAKNRSGRRWSISWNGFDGPFVRPYAF